MRMPPSRSAGPREAVARPLLPLASLTPRWVPWGSICLQPRAAGLLWLSRSALLRQNARQIKLSFVPSLNCAIRQHGVPSRCCAAITNSSSRNISSPQMETLYLPEATTQSPCPYPALSLDSPVLDIACEQNHAACDPCVLLLSLSVFSGACLL